MIVPMLLVMSFLKTASLLRCDAGLVVDEVKVPFASSGLSPNCIVRMV